MNILRAYLQFSKKNQPYLERYSVVVVIAEVLLLINEKTNKIKIQKQSHSLPKDLLDLLNVNYYLNEGRK